MPPIFRPLDPAFPIERQLAVDASPIVLVNIFTLDKAHEHAFLQVWQDDAQFMKQQPGFISTQLHRAIGESPCYLNYAVWENHRSFPGCFYESGFPGEAFGLSVVGRSFAASVPKGRGNGCLRRLEECHERTS